MTNILKSITFSGEPKEKKSYYLTNPWEKPTKRERDSALNIYLFSDGIESTFRKLKPFLRWHRNLTIII